MNNTLSPIFAIARMTFSEVLRNKVMYSVLLFLMIILLTATSLASVTMGRTEMMVLDIGLGSISMLSSLMAIVLTIQSIQQEKEGRMLYVLLTRISSRWQYILGKFIGLATIIGGLTTLMCLLLMLLVYLVGTPFWPSVIQACIATVLETWLIIAIAMIFAQASSLFLAILLSLSIDVAGRFTFTIQQFGQQSDSPSLHWITEVIYYLLPNLEAVNLRNSAGYIETYNQETMMNVFLYSFGEIGFLLIICMLVFERRDLH
ncbi:MAG: ABC transporter permease subunit [Mariprofundus sp.]|nr:ABC transporter permease subunit [Mariprofundus sp.]